MGVGILVNRASFLSVLVFSGFCTEKHSRGHWRLPKQDRYVCMSSKGTLIPLLYPPLPLLNLSYPSATPCLHLCTASTMSSLYLHQNSFYALQPIWLENVRFMTM